MRSLRLTANFQLLDTFEGKLCLPCNQFARFPFVRAYFKTVGRLGDGFIWYSMLVALPLYYGETATGPAVHMAATALVGVAVYKFLKTKLLRERPFASHAEVTAVSAPMDRYSCPSGHTLQAILFLVMLNAYFPPVAAIMLPFCLSVAASRVILGLHYPSDVLAGALIGWLVATASLTLIPL